VGGAKGGGAHRDSEDHDCFHVLWGELEVLNCLLPCGRPPTHGPGQFSAVLQRKYVDKAMWCGVMSALRVLRALASERGGERRGGHRSLAQNSQSGVV
jgi:hypothetical protein